MKKLYLISQDVNRKYDTFDPAVVCAESEGEARLIRPDGETWGGKYLHEWVESPEDVKVAYLGIADDSVEIGTVLGSFNAG